jgi:hypothetical protein
MVSATTVLGLLMLGRRLQPATLTSR